MADPGQHTSHEAVDVTPTSLGEKDSNEQVGNAVPGDGTGSRGTNTLRARRDSVRVAKKILKDLLSEENTGSNSKRSFVSAGFQVMVQNAEMLRRKCLRALSHSGADRDERDIVSLLAFCSKVNQVKSLAHDQQLRLVRCMTAETFAAEENVFVAGDVGDKYYVILEGSCDAIVLKPEEDPEKIAAAKAADPDAEPMMEQVVGHMWAKQGFGELALLHDAPRAATVRARIPTTCIVIGREDYQSIMKGGMGKDMEEKIEFLRKVPMMRGVSKATMMSLSFSFKREAYSRGHYLFREGEAFDRLYVIVSGEVALRMHTGDGPADTTARVEYDSNTKRTYVKGGASEATTVVTLCAPSLVGDVAAASPTGVHSMSCQVLSSALVVYELSAKELKDLIPAPLRLKMERDARKNDAHWRERADVASRTVAEATAAASRDHAAARPAAALAMDGEPAGEASARRTPQAAAAVREEAMQLMEAGNLGSPSFGFGAGTAPAPPCPWGPPTGARAATAVPSPRSREYVVAARPGTAALDLEAGYSSPRSLSGGRSMSSSPSLGRGGRWSPRSGESRDIGGQPGRSPFGGGRSLPVAGRTESMDAGLAASLSRIAAEEAAGGDGSVIYRSPSLDLSALLAEDSDFAPPRPQPPRHMPSRLSIRLGESPRRSGNSSSSSGLDGGRHAGASPRSSTPRRSGLSSSSSGSDSSRRPARARGTFTPRSVLSISSSGSRSSDEGPAHETSHLPPVIDRATERSRTPRGAQAYSQHSIWAGIPEHNFDATPEEKPQWLSWRDEIGFKAFRPAEPEPTRSRLARRGMWGPAAVTRHLDSDDEEGGWGEGGPEDGAALGPGARRPFGTRVGDRERAARAAARGEGRRKVAKVGLTSSHRMEHFAPLRRRVGASLSGSPRVTQTVA